MLKPSGLNVKDISTHLLIFFKIQKSTSLTNTFHIFHERGNYEYLHLFQADHNVYSSEEGKKYVAPFRCVCVSYLNMPELLEQESSGE